MRDREPLNPRPWRPLEVAEYVFLGAAVLGSPVAAVTGQVAWVTLPLILGLATNLLNRRRLETRLRSSTLDALGQVAQEQTSIKQRMLDIIETLEADGQTGDRAARLKSLVAAMRTLHQRQTLTEQSLTALQAQLESTLETFKKRPELEQIDDLRSVILDLQQFVNQLPQWGTLQQQQMRDLQQQIERALAEIPTQVAKAVRQQRRRSTSENKSSVS